MLDIALQILYKDEHIVAINKPHNLLVHRSPIAVEETIFALQILRDQLNCWVYPCHRIDRKTGGILLFSLSKEADRAMQMKFENRAIDKKYLSLVRGFLPEEGTTDRPLENEKGVMKDAVTHYFRDGKPFVSHGFEQFYLPERVPFEQARARQF